MVKMMIIINENNKAKIDEAIKRAENRTRTRKITADDVIRIADVIKNQS